MSLHLSNCHIVGNHMSQLICEMITGILQLFFKAVCGLKGKLPFLCMICIDFTAKIHTFSFQYQFTDYPQVLEQQKIKINLTRDLDFK